MGCENRGKDRVSILSARVANLRQSHLALNWSHANGLWHGTFDVRLLSKVRTVARWFCFFL